MTHTDVKIVKMYYCGKHETPFSEHRQHQQSPLQLPKLQAVKAVWWESTCVWKQKEEAVVVGSILAKVTHFPNSIMNRLKWYNWCGRVYLIPINIPRHLYNNNNGSRKVFHLVFICSRRRIRWNHQQSQDGVATPGQGRGQEERKSAIVNGNPLFSRYQIKLSRYEWIVNAMFHFHSTLFFNGS